MMNLPRPPDSALDIWRRLTEAGRETYFCGGCVRDSLLELPVKDYDLATAARPDEVEALFPRTVAVGKAFGVMVVVADDGTNYEVATFRSDGDYADGRRPDYVRFSSPEEDSRRRDFTINALFFDPAAARVLDFTGGLEDLKNRVIRAVGDPYLRFREDRLRLMRAIRFSSRLDFSIDQQTYAAIRELAPLVSGVSGERIAAELEGMLANRPGKAFRLLDKTGILPVVLPELAATQGVEQPPEFHPEGDVWTHTMLMLDLLDAAQQGDYAPPIGDMAAVENTESGMTRSAMDAKWRADAIRECRDALSGEMNLALRWSALLHDIGKPATFVVADRIRFNDHDRLGAEMAKVVMERLRRPAWLSDAAYDLIRRHIHFSSLRRMRKSKLRRWLREESFPAHLELHRLDCESSHRMLSNWEFGVSAWREEMALGPPPPKFIRGTDLLAMGMRPGPEMGMLIREIEDAVLEGEIANPEEARAWAEKKIGEGPPSS